MLKDFLNLKFLFSFSVIWALTYFLAPEFLFKSSLLWILVIVLVCLIQTLFPKLNKLLPYILFYSTGALTFFGYIKVLTGMDNGIINSVDYFWGYSFFSLSLSYLALNSKLNIKNILFLLNPIRFFTGPILFSVTNKLKNVSLKRISTISTWMILGIFFAYVLAPTLKVFFPLKGSTNAIDVLFFSFIYEFYVYLNFAGLSFLAMGFLRSLGVPCINNFNSPFSATNIIEYWQRWHIGLSKLCKALFYEPVKKRFGMYIAVLATFLSSAIWHGISSNFIIWGLFHTLAWLITYTLLKNNNKIYATLFFLPAVVFGRLIFSESNTEILFQKITSLVLFDTSAPSILFNHIGLGKMIIGLIVIFVVLAKAIFKFNNHEYKFYRKGWMPVILLISILLFVIDDNIVIYGAR